MFDAIKKLLGFGPKKDIGELIINGALIIDVRTAREYASGHIRKSVNIPLETLKGRISILQKDVPVITCCASGMRSSAARSILKSNGFGEVYNAGSWHNLKKYEK